MFARVDRCAWGDRSESAITRRRLYDAILFLNYFHLCGKQCLYLHVIFGLPVRNKAVWSIAVNYLQYGDVPLVAEIALGVASSKPFMRVVPNV